MASSNIKNDKLRAMYRSNEGYAKLFDALASRKQDREKTALETLAKDAAVDDYYKVAVPWARDLQTADVAEFKSGRHGHQTRLCWTRGVSLVEVGRMARGDDEPSPLKSGVATINTPRGGIVNVPADLTMEEAEFIYAWMKVLVSTAKRPGKRT